MGVDVVGTNKEGHIIPLKKFQQFHQIRSLSADSIQLVTSHGSNLSHFYVMQESLKIGTIRVVTTQTLIFILQKIIILW